MELYGISNCDTVRKARTWLTDHGLEYQFIDFKREGVDPERVAEWQQALGWETVLNRKKATWRGLPEERRTAVVNAASAARLMAEFPSLIKRPVLVAGKRTLAGFSEPAYRALLGTRD
jgi:arsenate reductase